MRTVSGKQMVLERQRDEVEGKEDLENPGRRYKEGGLGQILPDLYSLNQITLRCLESLG